MANVLLCDNGGVSGVTGIKLTSDTSGALDIKVGNGSVTGLSISAAGVTSSTNGVLSNTSFQVNKTGSDTAWSGPHFSLNNNAAGASERVWAWQLDASNNARWMYYNGSSWATGLTLDTSRNLLLGPVTTGSGVKVGNYSTSSDLSNTTVNGQNYAITIAGSKMFTVYLSNGDGALVFANYVSSTITIVAGGIAIVASSTPGAGQFGIWKDPNSHVINFKTGSNLSATAAQWFVAFLGTVGAAT